MTSAAGTRPETRPPLVSGRMGECYARPFAHPPKGNELPNRAGPGESGESTERFGNGTPLQGRDAHASGGSEGEQASLSRTLVKRAMRRKHMVIDRG